MIEIDNDFLFVSVYEENLKGFLRKPISKKTVEDPGVTKNYTSESISDDYPEYHKSLISKNSNLRFIKYYLDSNKNKGAKEESHINILKNSDDQNQYKAKKRSKRQSDGRYEDMDHEKGKYAFVNGVLIFIPNSPKTINSHSSESTIQLGKNSEVTSKTYSKTISTPIKLTDEDNRLLSNLLNRISSLSSSQSVTTESTVSQTSMISSRTSITQPATSYFSQFHIPSSTTTFPPLVTWYYVTDKRGVIKIQGNPPLSHLPIEASSQFHSSKPEDAYSVESEHSNDSTTSGAPPEYLMKPQHLSQSEIPELVTQTEPNNSHSKGGYTYLDSFLKIKTTTKRPFDFNNPPVFPNEVTMSTTPSVTLSEENRDVLDDIIVASYGGHSSSPGNNNQSVTKTTPYIPIRTIANIFSSSTTAKNHLLLENLIGFVSQKDDTLPSYEQLSPAPTSYTVPDNDAFSITSQKSATPVATETGVTSVLSSETSATNVYITETSKTEIPITTYRPQILTVTNRPNLDQSEAALSMTDNPVTELQATFTDASSISTSSNQSNSQMNNSSPDGIKSFETSTLADETVLENYTNIVPILAAGAYLAVKDTFGTEVEYSSYEESLDEIDITEYKDFYHHYSPEGYTGNHSRKDEEVEIIKNLSSQPPITPPITQRVTEEPLTQTEVYTFESFPSLGSVPVTVSEIIRENSLIEKYQHIYDKLAADTNEILKEESPIPLDYYHDAPNNRKNFTDANKVTEDNMKDNIDDKKGEIQKLTTEQNTLLIDPFINDILKQNDVYDNDAYNYDDILSFNDKDYNNRYIYLYTTLSPEDQKKFYLDVIPVTQFDTIPDSSLPFGRRRISEMKEKVPVDDSNFHDKTDVIAKLKPEANLTDIRKFENELENDELANLTIKKVFSIIKNISFYNDIPLEGFKDKLNEISDALEFSNDTKASMMKNFHEFLDTTNKVRRSTRYEFHETSSPANSNQDKFLQHAKPVSEVFDEQPPLESNGYEVKISETPITFQYQGISNDSQKNLDIINDRKFGQNSYPSDLLIKYDEPYSSSELLSLINILKKVFVQHSSPALNQKQSVTSNEEKHANLKRLQNFRSQNATIEKFSASEAKEASVFDFYPDLFFEEREEDIVSQNDNNLLHVERPLGFKFIHHVKTNGTAPDNSFTNGNSVIPPKNTTMTTAVERIFHQNAFAQRILSTEEISSNSFQDIIVNNKFPSVTKLTKLASNLMASPNANSSSNSQEIYNPAKPNPKSVYIFNKMVSKKLQPDASTVIDFSKYSTFFMGNEQLIVDRSDVQTKPVHHNDGIHLPFNFGTEIKKIYSSYDDSSFKPENFNKFYDSYQKIPSENFTAIPNKEDLAALPFGEGELFSVNIKPSLTVFVPLEETSSKFLIPKSSSKNAMDLYSTSIYSQRLNVKSSSYEDTYVSNNLGKNGNTNALPPLFSSKSDLYELPSFYQTSFQTELLPFNTLTKTASLPITRVKSDKYKRSFYSLVHNDTTTRTNSLYFSDFPPKPILSTEIHLNPSSLANLWNRVTEYTSFVPVYKLFPSEISHRVKIRPVPLQIISNLTLEGKTSSNENRGDPTAPSTQVLNPSKMSLYQENLSGISKSVMSIVEKSENENIPHKIYIPKEYDKITNFVFNTIVAEESKEKEIIDAKTFPTQLKDSEKYERISEFSPDIREWSQSLALELANGKIDKFSEISNFTESAGVELFQKIVGGGGNKLASKEENSQQEVSIVRSEHSSLLFQENNKNFSNQTRLNPENIFPGFNGHNLKVTNSLEENTFPSIIFDELSVSESKNTFPTISSNASSIEISYTTPANIVESLFTFGMSSKSSAASNEDTVDNELDRGSTTLPFEANDEQLKDFLLTPFDQRFSDKYSMQRESPSTESYAGGVIHKKLVNQSVESNDSLRIEDLVRRIASLQSLLHSILSRNQSIPAVSTITENANNILAGYGEIRNFYTRKESFPTTVKKIGLSNNSSPSKIYSDKFKYVMQDDVTKPTYQQIASGNFNSGNIKTLPISLNKSYPLYDSLTGIPTKENNSKYQTDSYLAHTDVSLVTLNERPSTISERMREDYMNVTSSPTKNITNTKSNYPINETASGVLRNTFEFLQHNFSGVNKSSQKHITDDNLDVQQNSVRSQLEKPVWEESKDNHLNTALNNNHSSLMMQTIGDVNDLPIQKAQSSQISPREDYMDSFSGIDYSNSHSFSTWYEDDQLWIPFASSTTEKSDSEALANFLNPFSNLLQPSKHLNTEAQTTTISSLIPTYPHIYLPFTKLLEPDTKTSVTTNVKSNNAARRSTKISPFFTTKTQQPSKVSLKQWWTEIIQEESISKSPQINTNKYLFSPYELFTSTQSEEITTMPFDSVLNKYRNNSQNEELPIAEHSVEENHEYIVSSFLNVENNLPLIEQDINESDKESLHILRPSETNSLTQMNFIDFLSDFIGGRISTVNKVASKFSDEKTLISSPMHLVPATLNHATISSTNLNIEPNVTHSTSGSEEFNDPTSDDPGELKLNLPQVLGKLQSVSNAALRSKFFIYSSSYFEFFSLISKALSIPKLKILRYLFI